MNILIATHGGLCDGLLDAFHMFAADVSQVNAIGLTDTGIDDFRKRLTAGVEESLAKGDVLILTDLLGGSPYNESYALFLRNPEHIRLVAGVNFPMLMEAGVLAMSSDDLEGVAAAAVAAGAAGIVAAAVPEDEADDDADLF